MDDIFKRVKFEDINKPIYNGSFIMATNPSQVSDIIGTLLSQDGIKYINKIQLNLIYMKTDPTIRLKNLYIREKSSKENYDELLRRYIDDQDKVVPSCEAIYKVAKTLQDHFKSHDLMIESVVSISNDYNNDTFYVLDSYINAFMTGEEYING